MNQCKVIAIANQKGGIGKTTATFNLGVGLARTGKNVLLIDCDPQGDLTICCGYPDNDEDEIDVTVFTIVERVMSDDDEISPGDGIILQAEGVDLLPANIELSDLELRLVSAVCRERVLSTYIEQVKDRYDYVLIHCMPSLGVITIGAFAVADSVIILVQSHYFPLKGMTQLTKNIGRIQRQINPKLKIDGIVLTLVSERTNLAKTTEQTIKEYYGSKLRIFDTKIPMAIKCAEISVVGKSIYEYDGNIRLPKHMRNSRRRYWNLAKSSALKRSFPRRSHYFDDRE